MSEYGPEAGNGIFTLRPAFKVTTDDYTRWGKYASGAPEYGPDGWRRHDNGVLMVRTSQRGTRPTLIEQENNARMIEEFLHERDKRIQAWMNEA